MNLPKERVAVGVRTGKLFRMQFKVKKSETHQRFAIIDIGNGDTIEANKTTATSKNITSKSVVCDKSNENTQAQSDEKSEIDETSKSANSAIASDDNQNTPSIETSKVDDTSQSSTSGTVSSDNKKKSDEKYELPKQAGAQQQQSKQHGKNNKIKDRRKSTVCDVLPENIVDSRLRNVKQTVREEDKIDGSDDNSNDYTM